MRLIAVGRMRAGPEAELFARYAARLRPKLQVREIAEAAGSAAEIRKREAEALLAALPAGAHAIVLDLGGTLLGSEALSAHLTRVAASGHEPAFIIGGAEGLAPEILARADLRLSLGAMTWPHMLVRVMLAEQIYRAQAIAAGHPYHRAWRP